MWKIAYMYKLLNDNIKIKRLQVKIVSRENYSVLFPKTASVLLATFKCLLDAQK